MALGIQPSLTPTKFRRDSNTFSDESIKWNPIEKATLNMSKIFVGKDEIFCSARCNNGKPKKI